MKKKTLGYIVIALFILSGFAVYIGSMKVPSTTQTSKIFGDRAYNGGNFFIDMVKQAPDNQNILHIHGTFTYDPKNNTIDGTVKIDVMNVSGETLSTIDGIIKYDDGALKIIDKNNNIYYYYAAPNAKEAFWKGFPALYEYGLHKDGKWTKTYMVNPDNQKIPAKMKEITPSNYFENMLLNNFGISGPFKYYLYAIKAENANVIVSVKLIVTYNNAIVFSQEIGLLPENQNYNTTPKK